MEDSTKTAVGAAIGAAAGSYAGTKAANGESWRTPMPGIAKIGIYGMLSAFLLGGLFAWLDLGNAQFKEGVDTFLEGILCVGFTGVGIFLLWAVLMPARMIGESNGTGAAVVVGLITLAIFHGLIGWTLMSLFGAIGYMLDGLILCVTAPF